MSKISKLFTNPGHFFRDYFVKRYPIVNSEHIYSEQEEYTIVKNQKYLTGLDQRIGNQFDSPVDVVFTWVNNNDENWLGKYYRHKNDAYDFLGLFAQDEARFENHNELYYSLYSVEKFLPWVRNIFIVTDNQKPSWLIPNHKVKIVDHTDLIDGKYLPTFNSHVIEAHLHKIPDLSENFIYFNDDVFVARKLKREHFFRSNDIASIFVSNKSLEKMFDRGVKTPTLLASTNAQELLYYTFSRAIDIPLVHTYIPLKKSSFEQVWQEYKTEIHGFIGNKFRSNNDLNLATFLVPWYMYLSQKSVITPEICYYFNIRSRHALAQYRKLLYAKETHKVPHSFCANDFTSSSQQIDNYQLRLETMLQQYFFH